MAQNDGERRMLFDIQGKRKHVVRVVYAILALLMGTSLFLVVGPVNIGELLGNSSSTSASAVLDEQAESIERRLRKDPTDEALLLALTRARINAGNSLTEVDPATGAPLVGPEAQAEFEQATATWSRYLKQAGAEPNASVALLVANSYFSLAQSSTELEEALEYVAKAAQAQQVAAEARPSVGSLSTLAIYQYFAAEFAAGDKTVKQAQELAPSKAQAKSIESQLVGYRKRGEQFEKLSKRLEKEQQGRGKEALENPLGGLAGATP